MLIPEIEAPPYPPPQRDADLRPFCQYVRHLGLAGGVALLIQAPALGGTPTASSPSQPPAAAKARPSPRTFASITGGAIAYYTPLLQSTHCSVGPFHISDAQLAQLWLQAGARRVLFQVRSSEEASQVDTWVVASAVAPECVLVSISAHVLQDIATAEIAAGALTARNEPDEASALKPTMEPPKPQGVFGRGLSVRRNLQLENQQKPAPGLGTSVSLPALPVATPCPSQPASNTVCMIEALRRLSRRVRHTGGIHITCAAMNGRRAVSVAGTCASALGLDANAYRVDSTGVQPPRPSKAMLLSTEGLARQLRDAVPKELELIIRGTVVTAKEVGVLHRIAVQVQAPARATAVAPMELDVGRCVAQFRQPCAIADAHGRLLPALSKRNRVLLRAKDDCLLPAIPEEKLGRRPRRRPTTPESGRTQHRTGSTPTSARQHRLLTDCDGNENEDPTALGSTPGSDQSERKSSSSPGQLLSPPWASSSWSTPHTVILEVGAALAECVTSDRPDGLIATVVCDEDYQALGLMYSTKDSIAESIRLQRALFYSRTAAAVDTSSDSRELLQARIGCDADSLLFSVRNRVLVQAHPRGHRGFCHHGLPTCWGPVYSTLHAALRAADTQLKTNSTGDSSPAAAVADLTAATQRLSAVSSNLLTADAIADLLIQAMLVCRHTNISTAQLQRRVLHRSTAAKVPAAPQPKPKSRLAKIASFDNLGLRW